MMERVWSWAGPGGVLSIRSSCVSVSALSRNACRGGTCHPPKSLPRVASHGQHVTLELASSHVPFSAR